MMTRRRCVARSFSTRPHDRSSTNRAASGPADGRLRDEAPRPRRRRNRLTASGDRSRTRRSVHSRRGTAPDSGRSGRPRGPDGWECPGPGRDPHPRCHRPPDRGSRPPPGADGQHRDGGGRIKRRLRRRSSPERRFCDVRRETIWPGPVPAVLDRGPCCRRRQRTSGGRPARGRRPRRNATPPWPRGRS